MTPLLSSCRLDPAYVGRQLSTETLPVTVSTATNFAEIAKMYNGLDFLGPRGLRKVTPLNPCR